MWVPAAAMAPPLRDLLLAPQDHVLWAILVAAGLFALAGLWLRRRERRAEERLPTGDQAARGPSDTRPE